MHSLRFLALAAIVTVAIESPAQSDIPWDSTKKGDWSNGFRLVEIPSSADGKLQKAYVFRSRSEKKMPLVISLHTWGGGYDQTDGLADLSAAADWNYIHPDFRGANTKPEACLSPLVIADINDAIAYAVANLNVDPHNIFLVGTSGGGHAACGMLLNAKHPIKRILAWVPITDLTAWHRETSEAGRTKYASNVAACTGDKDALNVEEAKKRSPMFMEIPTPLPCPIDLYAGIDDGWKGSVPISHSIRFFNRLAEHTGTKDAMVSEADSASLVARTYPPQADAGEIGGRKIIYQREIPAASLTIFQGGHEMLPAAAFARLQALAR